MHLLETHIQPYEWGSRHLLAELLGIAPTGGPMAELWVGAHPALPSTAEVDGVRRNLDTLISSDPRRWLGDRAIGRFGPHLPFLLKVLAVGAPLSLQAHPDLAQARAGFAAEEADGTAPEARSYRDSNHKPEMIVALTRLDALYGFRPLDDLAALRSDLAAPLLDAVLGVIDDAKDLRNAVGRLLRLAPADARALVGELAERAGTLADRPDVRHWIADLAGRYPHDPGVGVAVLLNIVRMEPGEALFVPAGVLHAYLDGLGVEILASSDNVMRGGLTPKHVDVDGLLHILDATPQRPHTTTLHDAPVCADFRLHRLGPVALRHAGPGMALCLTGEVHDHGGTALRQGEAAFWGANETVALSTDGLAFAATLGDLP